MVFGFSSSSKPPVAPAAPSFEDQLPTVICKFLNLFKYNFFIIQLREFLREYNRIAEVCFNDCINDFTGRTVTTSEVCYQN